MRTISCGYRTSTFLAYYVNLIYVTNELIRKLRDTFLMKLIAAKWPITNFTFCVFNLIISHFVDGGLIHFDRKSPYHESHPVPKQISQ